MAASLVERKDVPYEKDGAQDSENNTLTSIKEKIILEKMDL